MLTTTKAGLHKKKIMLSIWWDWKGVLYFELLPPNQTINSGVYCVQLEQLKAEVEQKWNAGHWVMSQHSQEALLLRFERRILKRIYGPVYADGIWRMRTNAELAGLYRNPDIVRVIKVRRLRWTSHVIRMAQDQILKMILDERIYGARRVGRPQLRWIDGMAANARSTWETRGNHDDEEDG
ncbi:uncharacterized protein [Halyomorpha halys]|uniref:uncharacterized protein n=1 Tax=Halyomorpha halys TaxID=286706 RepID=UPI0006D4E4EF|nr:uncharacterized protein LOC106683366 [Halyomorpha halys]